MNNRFKTPIHPGIYPGGPGLIRPFTHSPIHFYMKNKPNLKTSTIEDQESCTENMQNEPNFTIPNVEVRCRFTLGRLKKVLTISQNAPAFTKKLQKKRTFCNFLTLTHLTPYISMAYINIYPDIQGTGHERRAKFTRRSCGGIKMQNEPNCNPSTHQPMYPGIYPLRADSSTKLCKTNPISTSDWSLPAVCVAGKNAKRTQSENNPEQKAKSLRLNTID